MKMQFLISRSAVADIENVLVDFDRLKYLLCLVLISQDRLYNSIQPLPTTHRHAFVHPDIRPLQKPDIVHISISQTLKKINILFD